jgi:broad specificity phosphatase PhoE
VPTVLLVRHAQASFGSADYDVLSPAGLEQSALLASALDRRWDEYETEEVLAHHATAPAALDGTGPGGQEITSREFQAILDGALSDWAASGEGTPAGQSWPFFLESRASALGEFAAGLGSGETGLVFTSGGVIAAVCARLLGGDGELFPRLNRVLVNTGITKIAVGRSGASLVTFNEHAHIDEGGGALLTYR